MRPDDPRLRRRIRSGTPSVFRRRPDGQPSHTELLWTARQQAPPAPLDTTTGSPPRRAAPRPGKDGRDQKDGCGKTDGCGHPRRTWWWAANRNRKAARGGKERPVAKAGRGGEADAEAMLLALASKKAVRRRDVAVSHWSHLRRQAVLAVSAGLAVGSRLQLEQVLGGDPRRWWLVLSSLSWWQVNQLVLPRVAERVLRRWRLVANRDRDGSRCWLAFLGSPMTGGKAREQLAMMVADEAFGISGFAARPTQLLRWRGTCQTGIR